MSSLSRLYNILTRASIFRESTPDRRYKYLRKVLVGRGASQAVRDRIMLQRISKFREVGMRVPAVRTTSSA